MFLLIISHCFSITKLCPTRHLSCFLWFPPPAKGTFSNKESNQQKGGKIPPVSKGGKGKSIDNNAGFVDFEKLRSLYKSLYIKKSSIRRIGRQVFWKKSQNLKMTLQKLIGFPLKNIDCIRITALLKWAEFIQKFIQEFIQKFIQI